GVEFVDEAKEILRDQDDITSVVFKEMKKKDPKTGRLVPGNKYLQIKSNLISKNRGINLRGEGFEGLEKLYYTPEEIADRILTGKYKPIPTSDDAAAQAIFKNHREWWMGKALEPKNKSKLKALPSKIDYKKIEKKYAAKFEKRIKEQRVFFVIYRHNIEKEQIQGYRIWEKNNTRFLVNSDEGIKIYDRADKIALQLPEDPEKRRKAIALALSIAQKKGWDLKTMKINGSESFKKETQRQIAEIYKPGASAKVEPVPEKSKTYINAVKQLKTDRAEEKDLQKIMPERIKDIKIYLDPQAVIDYAAQKFELPEKIYTVHGAKIKDIRTKRKPRNVIDFLTKTCNQPVAEVFAILDDLLKIQDAEPLDDLLVDPEQTETKIKDDQFDPDNDDDSGLCM
ncbi:MAG: hypothetical protein GY718_06235, partial [Lentisphaerae bacterium]|nr:hypothetical protein [Lentisphaerota bacterium]